MTETQRQRFVHRAVKHLQRILLLDTVDIKVKFREMDDNVVGLAMVISPWRGATLTFDIYDSDMQNPEYLLKTVCHEMAHIVLDPLSLVASNLCNGDEFKQATAHNANESVTTHWEQVLFALVKDELL